MEDSLKTKGISAVFQGRDSIDGAGVRLKRIFGGQSTAPITDPFLLLDHFGSTRIEEYIKGFPWHPHRGIETITYLMDGKVEHEDSEGNKGTIYPGDLQWMSSGSGIYHQEMPKPIEKTDPKEAILASGLPESSVGLQLWLNMPSGKKMNKPAYREINGRKVENVKDGHGVSAKVIAGKFLGAEAEFHGDPAIDPTYIDVKLDPETEFSFKVPPGYNSLVYIITGSVRTGPQMLSFSQRNSIVFDMDGANIKMISGETGSRFLLLTGKPLREPVYWYGPIVMNTENQLEEAFRDLKNGTFIRDREPLFL